MLNSKASWELEWQLIFLLQFYMKGAPETCTPPCYLSIHPSFHLFFSFFLPLSLFFSGWWGGLMGCWCGSCQWHCVCFRSLSPLLSLCSDSGLLTNASSHLGTLGNLCYHFVSRMTEAVNVSNSPRDREPSCWQCLTFRAQFMSSILIYYIFFTPQLNPPQSLSLSRAAPMVPRWKKISTYSICLSVAVEVLMIFVA